MSLTKKVYEHIDRLEKENKRLEKYIDNLQVVHFTELQTEKAENARLRKTLEFYAAGETWHQEHIKGYEYKAPIALNDEGKRARQALEGSRCDKKDNAIDQS